MKTILAALSFVSLIILFSTTCKLKERCDHALGVDCGADCPGGCPDTVCCEGEGIDTCANKPGFVCQGCNCEEGVDCWTDTCPKNFELYLGGNGDDEGWSIVKNTDDNYLVAGKFYDESTGNNDVYLVKINTFGTLDWAFHDAYSPANDPFGEYATDLMELQNGDLVAVGNRTRNGTDSKFYLVRTESDGNPVWNRENGINANYYGYSITNQINPDGLQTSSDGFAIFGHTDLSTSSRGEDAIAYLVKSDGSYSANYPIENNPFNDYGSTIEASFDNNYLMLATVGKASGSRLVLYKVPQDLSKNIIWTTEIIASCLPQHRASLARIGTTAAAGGSASYIVAGATATGLLRLVTVEKNGTVLKEETITGTTITGSVSVIATSDGGFASLTDDMTLIKVNADLSEAWRNDQIGGESFGVHSLVQADDNGYVLVGAKADASSGNSDTDLYIVKVNEDGTLPESN